MEKLIETKMGETAKEAVRDILWFGQVQILGELVNADPLKAQSEPKNTRAIARNFIFSLRAMIDKETERIPDIENGRVEVFVAACQVLGRFINKEYQRAMNNPDEIVKFAIDQAIESITEFETELVKEFDKVEESKKESEVTED